MPECPECENYYEEDELNRGRCPTCGRSLIRELPGYPNRRGKGITETFTIAFEMMKNNLLEYVKFLMIPLVILASMNIYMMWQMSNVLTSFSSFSSPEEIETIIPALTNLMVLFIPMTLFRYILEFLIAGGIVKLTVDAFEGKAVDFTSGLSVIKEHLFSLVGAGVILTLLLSIGFALCLIPALFFCYWWLFTVPIIILESKGLINAMKKSKRIAKWADTLGFTVAFIIIVLVLQGVGGTITSLLTNTPNFYIGGLSGSTFHFGYMTIVGQVVGVFVQLLILSYAFTAVTTHYLRAGPRSGGSEGSESKPSPPPVN